MSNKKNFWYVIVMEDDGPAFVTSVNHLDKTAYWNKDEKPIELGESTAKDLAFGLMCNFNLAYAICSRVEIKNQPYCYDRWQIEWKEKGSIEGR